MASSRTSSPIVQVALPVPLYQTFDYLLPDGVSAMIGGRVKVPFGKRKLIGIVVGITSSSSLDIALLKTVEHVVDDHSLFTDDLWQLLHWAASYYHYPLGEVLLHALPVLLRQGESSQPVAKQQWQITAQGAQIALASLQRAPRQQAALAILQQQPLQPSQLAEFSLTSKQLTTLVEKQWAEQVALNVVQDEWFKTPVLAQTPLTLNTQQSIAIAAIRHQPTPFTVWLLDGVTGSGKTEVYLQAIEPYLQQGQQILVLVPEIGLTPQTISRFRQRFHVPIAVLHSALTDKERLMVWQQAKQGQVALVIGTRSALFTPFARLGMIIIDEEHDASYKQQEGWRYHARDLAVMRAKLQGIPLLMGSATPSLETLQNVAQQKYHHLSLQHRAGPAKAVKQQIVDLKNQRWQAGIADSVLKVMKHHLANGNQVLLFLNRRGYAPTLICHECGWIAECQRCDRYYTLHQQPARLHCHHCDGQRPVARQCPVCGSSQLLGVGLGTQQLESQLSVLFPQIPITRVDRDSTRRKGAFAEHLANIDSIGARILIGTQMLAKGHHFPNVTLVVLLDVDGALFSADFRAAERFAQLYTQVSGRAGRALKAGEVILQTHQPEHPLLQLLLQQGYAAFAQQTLTERQMARLPPFSQHVMITAYDQDNQRALSFLQSVAKCLAPMLSDPADILVLGPMPALMAKKRGCYYWQLLLQHDKRALLQKRLAQLLPLISTLPLANKVRWSVDVDPQ